MRTAKFYIGNELIETFTFDPYNIGLLTTTELPKHSIITDAGAYVESIIWHIIEDDLFNEVYSDDKIYKCTYSPKVYSTEKTLKIVIK